MNTDPVVTTKNPRFDVKEIIRFILVLTLPLVFFLIADKWDWWKAWVYILITYISAMISRWIVLRKNPDLLTERAKFTSGEGIQSWDRYLVRLVVYLPLLILIIAVLDLSYGWSPQSELISTIIGLVLILIGVVISGWAFVVNQFFSSVVRLQTNRGHFVIDQGPYHIIRHPGYLGGLLSMIGLPLFMGSNWAWVPAVLGIVAIIIRTYLEDSFLQKELSGYAEYSGRVKFRMIPGVW